MNRSNSKRNKKGRICYDVIIDKSEQRQIKLDFQSDNDYNEKDDNNPLVLPSKKRKTKILKPDVPKKRKLSKKERKKLQNVIDRREKKNKRMKLLDDLSKTQLLANEISLMSSTTDAFNNKSKSRLDIKKDEMGHIIKENSDESNFEISDDDDSEIKHLDLTTESNQQHAISKNNENNFSSSSEEEQVSTNSINSTPEIISKPKTLQKLEKKPVTFIPCYRNPEIQQARLKLPIVSEEQVIMETINENDVTILCGETGSGKSTQTPQFLYEAGYTKNDKMIVITEPRRVAAINVSKRVAIEMNLSTKVVSYQIRYEGNVTDKTQIKFVTDGVLLKEMQKDLMLQNYSVVIIDEAHERSVNTDVLIGLLSRIVPLRKKKGDPLKLIIMSATLRSEDFTNNKHLFCNIPPVISIDSRQFNVKISFSRHTPKNYLKSSYNEVCRIHRKNPPGGILIFVTGRREVNWLCSKLKTSFPIKSNKLELDNPNETFDKKRKKKKNLPNINLQNYSALPDDEEESDMEFIDNDDNEFCEDDELSEDDEFDNSCFEPLQVQPFYSLLESNKQQEVFARVPEGRRLCVVATNVAETSITIPYIKYVLDTGKVKKRKYDKKSGCSRFEICWISKASASQRSGRAGRMSEGFCYRLYSTAVFEHDMSEFDDPDIVCKPTEDLYLQMKSMNIDYVTKFPFPTPPSTDALLSAEQHLLSLKALEKTEDIRTSKTVCRLTELGKTMAILPISPKYAKMISIAYNTDVILYIINITAALSVNQLFDDYAKCKRELGNVWQEMEYKLLGDFMCLLTAIGATEQLRAENEFCTRIGLRWKALLEVRKLRQLVINTINSSTNNIEIQLNLKLDPPSLSQSSKIRQILLSGFVDHVAKLECKFDSESKKKKKYYQPLIVNDPTFVDGNSIVNHKKEEYNFIIYNEMNVSSDDVKHLTTIAVIDECWLPKFCDFFCKFEPYLKYDRNSENCPYYDKSLGKVMCFNNVRVELNEISWKLSSLHVKPFPNGMELFRLFAKFFLDGEVFESLKSYQGHLLHSANMLVLSLSLPTYARPLLTVLVEKNIDNKDKMITEFKTNKLFLQKEYCMWLPEVYHQSIKWPPL